MRSSPVSNKSRVVRKTSAIDECAPEPRREPIWSRRVSTTSGKHTTATWQASPAPLTVPAVRRIGRRFKLRNVAIVEHAGGNRRGRSREPVASPLWYGITRHSYQSTHVSLLTRLIANRPPATFPTNSASNFSFRRFDEREIDCQATNTIPTRARWRPKSCSLCRGRYGACRGSQRQSLQLVRYVANCCERSASIALHAASRRSAS